MPPKLSPLPNLRQIVCARSPLKGIHTETHPPLHSKPGRFTFPSLLKNCTTHLNLNHGKTIHACLIPTALQSDPYIAASLITMYAKCGSLSDAAHVFDQLPHRDTTVWNAIIAAHFHHNHRSKGLSLFRQMQSLGAWPDGHSLSILLSACHNGFALKFGKQAHAYIVRNAMDGDAFLATALIDIYAKCGALFEAHKVFDELADKSVFAWNAMISGFCHNGLWERSLELFAHMRSYGPRLQPATFSSVLTACSIGEAADFGAGIHSSVIKLGFEVEPYVCTSLLAMYARCGLIDEACRVFHSSPNRRVELWNSMISAYIGKGCACEALDLYREMRLTDVRGDRITASNMLSACGVMGLLDLGRAIHGELIKGPELDSLAVQTSLMTMYMKAGSIEDAELLFSSDADLDIVVWGSMISGFCQNKKFDRALSLFSRLRAKGLRADSAFIASAASACAGLECVEMGFLIHGHAIKSGLCFDVFAGSALIDMYAKCGAPHLACSVLNEIPQKNLVVWNSMISGYGHNGMLDESIQTFSQILQNGMIPDSISITSVLAPVSSSGALAKGKMIHGYQVKNGIICDIYAENALLDMYMKCGCLRYAQNLFNLMPTFNIMAWNTMISGFGSNGHCLEAIRLFEKMQRLDVLPDETTFLSLISSCSHSGLVEEGLALFKAMTRDYGIMSQMEHYTNMVDLLGRAGRLDEAYCFIKDMLDEPDESVWLCLLSACRARRSTGLGEIAADQLLKLKPEGSGTYTQLLNFYGELGMMEKAASVKVQMREAGVKKNPGCSWIEMKDRVEVFYSGDSSSPLILVIHDTLRDLRRIMRDDEFL